MVRLSELPQWAQVRNLRPTLPRARRQRVTVGMSASRAADMLTRALVRSARAAERRARAERRLAEIRARGIARLWRAVADAAIDILTRAAVAERVARAAARAARAARAAAIWRPVRRTGAPVVAPVRPLPPPVPRTARTATRTARTTTAVVTATAWRIVEWATVASRHAAVVARQLGIC